MPKDEEKTRRNPLLSSERAALSESGLTTGGLAEDGGASLADDDGLSVREDGGDGEAVAILCVQKNLSGLIELDLTKATKAPAPFWGTLDIRHAKVNAKDFSRDI